MSQPNVLDLELTLQTLNYATRMLASELDAVRLVSLALDTLADFGRASRVALLRVHEDEQTVEVAGELSRSGLVDPDRRIVLAASPLGQVVRSRQFETFGIAPDESLPLPFEGDGPAGRECLCLPLLGSHNDVIAIATCDRATLDPLAEFDLQVLRIIGTLIGAALENSRLFQLATVDGLTGLYVRRYFEIRLAEELARVRRLGGQVALLMTDIDHFKQFNDTYGHQVGDHVLRRMADLLKDSIRRGIDIPCRYGGEE
ncbi:MAG: diguanylate cyclase, partial [Armatimonadetes bacterium]|nr:diguanylate cyclase [Armatimonadota bacterium]